MTRIREKAFKVKDTHESRREQILLKYPRVKELMVVERRTKYVIVFLVMLQTITSIAAANVSNTAAFFALSYVVGATLAHCLFLAIHEVSHNSAFASVANNQFLGMVANLPIAIPYSAVFRRYHLQHHYSLGTGTDTDIPSRTECYLVSYTSTCYLDHVLRKTAYMSCYVLFYALRPVVMRPDIFRADKFFAINVAAQLAFDCGIYYLFGVKPLVFMVLSTFLAGSLHPMSGRFLSEHLVLQESDEVETYSYYGHLNKITFNVGYHSEHHDMPTIPYTKLPELSKIAPEFYTDLPVTKGWLHTLVSFIFDDSVGPHCRVTRRKED